MLRNAVNFKNIVDLFAGVVGMVFDQLERLEAEETEAVETAVTVESEQSDDLTAISGIGRAFAQRFNEAGITTYRQLAGLTTEQVRDITRAAQWQGDPGAWIAEAEELAEA